MQQKDASIDWGVLLSFARRPCGRVDGSGTVLAFLLL
jgi:hypothetical protein